jgi:hypothetical protein
VIAAVLLLMESGCSSKVESPAPAASPTQAASGGGGLTVVLASSDLAVGPNRFVFGVLDNASSPIRTPEARVTFLYLESTPYQERAQASARFVKWPAAAAGVYVADVAFDRDGRWGAVVKVTGQDGTASSSQTAFLVKSQSSSPGIGQPAPRSRNKTAADVHDLAEISSAAVPDPGLYEMTIEEAASSGKPTIVTFAAPAFCQTATCGPQVEVVSSIKDRYRGRANFIHVEVYDNPREMEGDLTKGRLSPLLEEWGLVTEPFTFVLDRNGLVAFKFEGFATQEELEAALAATLGS